jgi:23S rRNA (cytosine1962-C5)-methyltransferase
MKSPLLRIKNPRARALRGHPWVFAGEVESLPDPSHDGQAVPLHDLRGRLIGYGLYNSRSSIVWRFFSATATDCDADYLRTALTASIARRDGDPARRLVWSEADGLPGLVVDRFGDTLVVQTLTLGMEQRLETILGILETLLAPATIILRNDAPSRQHEGLEAYARVARGESGAVAITLDGVQYSLDLLGGQKTGFYLDQRSQHVRVGALARGRTVLDACCNQGGFALQCALHGARSVLGVDSAAHAIEAARRNAATNQLAVEFEEANIFDWFTAHREARFDLIILDPPSFAPNRKALSGALRGYKELNLRALRALNPGGILATYACSHHIDAGTYYALLEEAAFDARRQVRLLEETGQPPDHPTLLNFPESRYLKGALLQAE